MNLDLSLLLVHQDLIFADEHISFTDSKIGYFKKGLLCLKFSKTVENEAIKRVLLASFQGHRTLILFGESLLLLYELSGQEFLLNLPFRVKQSIKFSKGIILEREVDDENDNLPSLFTLTDPFKDFGVVEIQESNDFTTDLRRSKPVHLSFVCENQHFLAIFLDIESRKLIIQICSNIDSSQTKGNNGPQTFDSYIDYNDLNTGQRRSAPISALKDSEILSYQDDFHFSGRDIKGDVKRLSVSEQFENQFLPKEMKMHFYETIDLPFKANFDDFESFSIHNFNVETFCGFSKTNHKAIFISFEGDSNIEPRLRDVTSIDALGICPIKNRLFESVCVLWPDGKLRLESPLAPPLEIISNNLNITGLSSLISNCLKLEKQDGEMLHLKIRERERSRMIELALDCLKVALSGEVYQKILVVFEYCRIKFIELDTESILSAVFYSIYLSQGSEKDMVKFKLHRTSKEPHFECVYDSVRAFQIVRYENLHQYLSSIYLTLYLLREEFKTDLYSEDNLSSLDVILCRIANWIGWRRFVSHHEMNIPWPMTRLDCIKSLKIEQPDWSPFSILSWAISRFNDGGSKVFPRVCDIDINFPYFKSFTQDTQDLSINEGGKDPLNRTSLLRSAYEILRKSEGSIGNSVEAISNLGFTRDLLETFPIGLSCPIWEAISQVRDSPSKNWGVKELEFVGRDDLKCSLEDFAGNLPKIPPILDLNSHQLLQSLSSKSNSTTISNQSTHLDYEQEIFRADRRLKEVEKMLDFTCQVNIKDISTENFSEHQAIIMQQNLGKRVALRTLSISLGFGLFKYDTETPDFTKPLAIPKFTFSVKILPSKVMVTTDVNTLDLPLLDWCKFHVGCSAALSIGQSAKDLNGSWITYNSPEDLNAEHAGFLLGLGLNGHLTKLATWNAFNYLVSKHVLTSIAVLIGMSVSYLGTMNSMVTRLLSVHIPALLPKGSSELNLSPLTQTAGLLGIGLLFCQTEHRMMNEITFRQLCLSGDIVGIEENKIAMYRIAAGFSLGFINLCKGNNLKAQQDVILIQSLLKCVSRLPTASNIEQASSAAGAIVSLGLMFLQTGNRDIASRLRAPTSIALLDYIRPDILILRILADSLIMWCDISPSIEWITNKLPSEWKNCKLINDQLDSCDINLYLIIGAACFSIALRFAGTNEKHAKSLLIQFLDQLTRLSREPINNYDEKSCLNAVMQSIDMIALALGILSAGSGDLMILRRIRLFHGRVSDGIRFGDHCAAHMALGLLFLGKGKYSLSRSPVAIASLFCAFFPNFPTSEGANLVNLEAFRHLWVLAVERRAISTRQIGTGNCCAVSALVSHDHRIERIECPCWLPPIPEIDWIQFEGVKWPLKLDMSSDLHKSIMKRKDIIVSSNTNDQKDSSDALYELVQQSETMLLADYTKPNQLLNNNRVDQNLAEILVYLTNALRHYRCKDDLLMVKSVLDFYTLDERRLYGILSIGLDLGKHFLPIPFIEATQIMLWVSYTDQHVFK